MGGTVPVLALAALTLLSVRGAVLKPAPAEARKIPPFILPFAGNGTCEEAVHDHEAGTTTVQCLGPPHYLSAGQTINTNMLLESPYPKGKIVAVLNTTAQLVDSNLRPVPLSEVYVHHYGGRFLPGSGAELRGSFSRKALPEPYVLTANGTEAAEETQRFTNIQLINTVGLPEHKAKPCLECWCDHDPWHVQNISSAHLHHLSDSLAGPKHDSGDPTHNDTHPGTLAGSVFCCHQCPSDTPMSGPIAYHLQYTVTYRDLKPSDVPVYTTVFDVMGGSFEYQITEAMGQGSTHIKTFDTIFAAPCSDSGPVDIVRCGGHQHFGGQCATLIDLEKNATICQTCPSFGKRKGVPGDEEGYVVRIPDDDLAIEDRTYSLKPGSRVRFQSAYDASIPRFGVMALQVLFVDGLPEKCRGTFNDGGNSNVLSASDGVMSTPLYGGMFGYPLKVDSADPLPTA